MRHFRFLVASAAAVAVCSSIMKNCSHLKLKREIFEFIVQNFVSSLGKFGQFLHDELGVMNHAVPGESVQQVEMLVGVS